MESYSWDQWAFIVFVGIFLLAGLYGLVCFIVSKTAGLLKGSEAKYRIERKFLAPLDWIAFAIKWPKLQLDRLAFYREFGFKPWEFHKLSREQELTIEMKVSEAADSLQRAYARETQLLDSERFYAVEVAELKGARLNIAEAEKRFWRLHWLSGRIGKQICDGMPSHKEKCSFKYHLTESVAARKRAQAEYDRRTRVR